MTKSITAIINVQALKWEQRRQTKETLPPEAQQPMITISSEYGSQGQQIGRLVAEKLGFDFYDRELIDRIASSANASRRVVESLDNRVRDWITEHIAGQFDSSTFTSSEYLRHLSRVVLGLGHHGRAVIIGRGSQFILDPRYTLRVRTMAPLEYRVAYVSQAEGISEQDARAVVLRVTSERAAFCRLHFNRDVGDASYYDLVINTATTTPELNAELVVSAFRSRFQGAVER